jgi:hypothetical protein
VELELMPVKVIDVGRLFVIVTVELLDVAPTTVLLKVTDAGEAPTPVLPVPVSGTVTGLGEAS